MALPLLPLVLLAIPGGGLGLWALRRKPSTSSSGPMTAPPIPPGATVDQHGTVTAADGTVIVHGSDAAPNPAVAAAVRAAANASTANAGGLVPLAIGTSIADIRASIAPPAPPVPVWVPLTTPTDGSRPIAAPPGSVVAPPATRPAPPGGMTAPPVSVGNTGVAPPAPAPMPPVVTVPSKTLVAPPMTAPAEPKGGITTKNSPAGSSPGITPPQLGGRLLTDV